MGGNKHYGTNEVKLRSSQRSRLGTSNLTRITIGGYEKITYKEIVNGITIIRTRWRNKKTKEKYRRT